MQESLKSRLIIHQILKELKNSNKYFDDIFEKKTKNKNFSDRDKKLIYTVTLNSMRNQYYVNKIIEIFCKKNITLSDSYFLLLSGITQLIILNFKDFAVINSTVELTKIKEISSSTKFINGVLRSINRNKNNLPKIEVNFSKLPLWFRKKVFWSKNQKQEFLKTITREPDLHLVYKNKNYIKNINCDFVKTTNYSLVIKNKIKIKDISGYKDGHWWIQDFAAMMPIHLSKNLKDKKVADLCAAPGGKSFQLITKKANVTAFEIDKDRSKILINNLKRLKLNCNIVTKDILKLSGLKKFDIIILDAPCSSIGTIRRNPEILFRKKSPKFNEIALIQNNLLNKAKELLNSDGLLIYMVCSFFHDEGAKIINNFLMENRNFSIKKILNNNSNKKNAFIDENGFYYVLPKKLKNGVLIDGFFAAKLKKND